MASIINALSWANENDFDYVVKLSRRYLPVYNWVDPLKKHIEETGFAATYSNTCEFHKLPIRTEAIVFKTEKWANYPLNKFPRSVEHYISDVADMLGRDSWPMLGKSRKEKNPYILWHDVDSHASYALVSWLYGLHYTSEDFKNPDQGSKYIRFNGKLPLVNTVKAPPVKRLPPVPLRKQQIPLQHISHRIKAAVNSSQKEEEQAITRPPAAKVVNNYKPVAGNSLNMPEPLDFLFGEEKPEEIVIVDQNPNSLEEGVSS
jgi:hypothetical protein